MEMAVELTRAQRQAVENTGGPLLVSAAAGAGKTRVLVERLMDRVRGGEDVDRFLVITFTNAAAAELRGRIGEELSRALAQEPGNRHLRRQLTLVYQAHISTIHAYCGDLLRQWGYLLDLESDYRLMDEMEARLLLQETAEELLERRYDAPDETFALLLDIFSAGRDDLPLRNMVLEIYAKLQSHPDPASWLRDQAAAFDLTGVSDVAQTPWGAYLLERIRSLAAYWHGQLAPLLEECRTGVDAYCDSLEKTVEDLACLAQAKGWKDAVVPEFQRLGSSAKCADPALADRVKALRERCKSQLAKALEPLAYDSAHLLAQMEAVAPAAQALLGLVGELSEAYEKNKAKRGVLDFNDLEHKALRLLEGYPQAAQACAEGFAEVMVDEYQDTNQVQNAIFHALTRARGNLFMVGDVKQSIYRFRLADPTIFLDKYRAYPPAETAASGQGRRVILGENFRCRGEIIDCVNYLFANLMSRDLGELDYGPEEALRQGLPAPEREDCACELHLLESDDVDLESDRAMIEPRFVARRLHDLLAQGFSIPDGQGGERRAEPGDMAILLRSPGPSLGRYVQALRELDIPWASEGGEDFFDTPEVSVALSYLEILDNPRQDVPLIAVLRSPLYRFTPDRLAQLGGQREEGCFYDALVADGGEDCQEFLRDLQALRELARDARSYELIWEVYCRTGLLSLYASMPGGAARRENLLALHSCAKQFDATGHKGLFSFLEHLRRRREEGESFPVPSGGSGGGVRILSIHRAKGLEFPIVVVAGLGKRFNHADSRQPMLFHRDLGLGPQGLDTQRLIRYPTLCRWAVAAKLEEEMLSEELRLLYVALTRAREKLILTCAMRNTQREIEHLMEQAELPVQPQALTHMATPGHWVLCAALSRPEAGAIRLGLPLVHTPPAGAAFGRPWEIAFHDGAAFQTRPTRTGTVTDLPQAQPVQVPDYTWVYPWEEATALPSKLTATQLKGRTLDGEVGEEAPPTPRASVFRRPDFALERGLTPSERGTAHHLVMQYLDYGKAGSPEALEEELDRLQAQAFITPQQRRAVDPAVFLTFFRSPLGREALAAGGGLHREFKFSLLAPAEKFWPQLPPGEEVLLQGVVDCFFDTPGGLVVVDFKSDRVTQDTVADRAEEYRPQLEAYAAALSTLLERPVDRKVLWFFALGRAVEV